MINIFSSKFSKKLLLFDKNHQISKDDVGCYRSEWVHLYYFNVLYFPFVGYKTHTDCREDDDKQDRFATILVYLDDVAVGGETKFPGKYRQRFYTIAKYQVPLRFLYTMGSSTGV